MHLAQIWTSFQDEMVLLSVLSNILVSLEPFSQVLHLPKSNFADCDFVSGISYVQDTQAYDLQGPTETVRMQGYRPCRAKQ